MEAGPTESTKRFPKHFRVMIVLVRPRSAPRESKKCRERQRPFRTRTRKATGTPSGQLGMTDRRRRSKDNPAVPARIDVAIPRGNRIPTLLSPVDVRVFSKEIFELGRREFNVGDGFAVGSVNSPTGSAGQLRSVGGLQRSPISRRSWFAVGYEKHSHF